MLKDDNPLNENSKALKQKILFLERSIQVLEKERSELSVRATMAEEQLKYFKDMQETTSRHYQAQILSLNKKVNKFYFKFFSLKQLV